MIGNLSEASGTTKSNSSYRCSLSSYQVFTRYPNCSRRAKAVHSCPGLSLFPAVHAHFNGLTYALVDLLCSQRLSRRPIYPSFPCLFISCSGDVFLFQWLVASVPLCPFFRPLLPTLPHPSPHVPAVNPVPRCVSLRSFCVPACHSG